MSGTTTRQPASMRMAASAAVALLLFACAAPVPPSVSPLPTAGSPAPAGVTPGPTGIATSPSVSPTATATAPGSSPTAARDGIHKIKHVVVIMQENRSFDQYFGTYPGRRRHPDAGRRARRSACRIRGPGACVKPYHDPAQ